MKCINTIILVGIIIAVVAGGAGFWGGMQYQKSKNPFGNRNFGANFSGPGVQAQNNTRRSGGLQGGFAAGDITAKSDNSITLKMRDGSSRIIFFSGSTQITKQASGTVDDLAVGSSVMVQGSANSDGSVTAQVISLRPAGSVPMMQGGVIPGNSAPGGANPGNGNPTGQGNNQIPPVPVQ